MTTRPIVLIALIITLSTSCSAIGQPDLGDSSLAPATGNDNGRIDDVDSRFGDPPRDLAFATDSAESDVAGSDAARGGSDDSTSVAASGPGTSPSGLDSSSSTETESERTATPIAAPMPVTIAPNSNLHGVELGTDAEIAIAELVSVLGVPDVDTGWYVGCPLDGESLDERLLRWGDLNAYFDRDDRFESFVAWGFDLRVADGGIPPLDLVELPGGSHLGDPINAVAAAAGLSVVTDEAFGVNRVGVSGFEVLSDLPLGAPAWGVFVPAIPLCG